MSLSPHRVLREMSRVDQLREELGEKFDMNSVESETDALEVLDAFVEAIIADEALANKAKERAKRLEARADKHRATVLAILQEKLQVSSIERPLFTASISHRTGVEITDEGSVPLEFQRIAPDKVAIAAALRKGEDVPGAVLGNAAPILTLRTN